MYGFLSIILLIFTFNNLSEAKYEKKLPSAVVVGTVYCDTCFQTDFSKTSHFISGALVAVECGVANSKPSFREEVKTNERGEFEVHLPLSVSKHVKKIKECSVKLISSSEPYCAVASAATSYSLKLKSRKQGTHIFSAGFFTFKPLKQPTLCSQKPSLLKSKEFNSQKSLPQAFASPIFPIPPTTQEPTVPIPGQPPTNQNLLPPLPVLPNLPPLPQLPPLPSLPGFPNFPKQASENSEKLKSTDPFKTLEVPLFPSPRPGIGSQLPPNPFQPPSFFPPNPFLPPPLTLPPNVPPLVGLTPSLPPPPTNVPVGLPPFPFQPSPGFPGIPPIRQKTSP
ncbi:hypothetical protein Vadar_033970 [Vaccinium darrowii]|uniref:Uncharacterized protein n=1 Tax=Vaccinium darrowii TaxID=229202 RepID=A0ACB7Y563_9ERIC|nr:hypothetical protein Vadar_033970 [Vaccinium darrowii]